MTELFVPIIDTREKLPFVFANNAFCKTPVITSLKTGDYSIQGMEDDLFIDRKGSLLEFARNIVEKRFIRELERTSTFRWKFIICEFDYSEIIMFPHNQPIPQHVKNKIKVSPNFIFKKIIEYQINYSIHFIMAGSRELANKICINVMKEVYERRNFRCCV